MFIRHKAQLFCAQIKAQKFGLRAVRACIKDRTTKLASHQTHNVHALAKAAVVAYTAGSGGPVWIKVLIKYVPADIGGAHTNILSGGPEFLATALALRAAHRPALRPTHS